MKPLTILIIIFCLLPLVTANQIDLSHNEIYIKNYISNIEQFSDYEFISLCETETQSYNLISIKVDHDTGLIPPYRLTNYYCKHSVYAIKKSDFRYDWEDNKWIRGSVQDYLKNVTPKKVIAGVESYKKINIMAGIKDITNYYNIDLDLTKNNPDKVDIQRSRIFYIYIIIPIIALIIILTIFILKRSKK